MEETEPATISVVPEPEKYTLTMYPDESVEIMADCNMLLGTYSLEGDSIAFLLGPAQMAFCGEDSLDVQYLEFLGKVESFTLDGTMLKLNLADGSGTMTFE